MGTLGHFLVVTNSRHNAHAIGARVCAWCCRGPQFSIARMGVRRSEARLKGAAAQVNQEQTTHPKTLAGGFPGGELGTAEPRRWENSARINACKTLVAEPCTKLADCCPDTESP